MYIYVLGEIMDFLKRTWAEISIPALLHNFNLIKKHAEGSYLMPVVKADAYGHGAQAIATALESAGADSFAVSNLEEALKLREYGIGGPILILGYTPPELAAMLPEKNIVQAVFSLEYARELSKNASGKVIPVHIKIDTGMGRIGFDARSEHLKGLDDILKVYSLENLKVTGIFTHFCVADSVTTLDAAYTEEQYSRFLTVIEKIKSEGLDTGLIHCSNSAGIIHSGKFLMDICRPGIILYGLNPSGSVKLEGIKPVMTLKSVISMVKRISEGETLSYGRNFIAERDMTVATVTAGYADGYPRLLSNKGEVIVNGKRAKIIGNICMDQFMIDVTDIENVKSGDEVILFGEELTADEVAERCSTIGYEIICGINIRVPRVIIK